MTTDDKKVNYFKTWNARNIIVGAIDPDHFSKMLSVYLNESQAKEVLQCFGQSKMLATKHLQKMHGYEPTELKAWSSIWKNNDPLGRHLERQYGETLGSVLAKKDLSFKDIDYYYATLSRLKCIVAFEVEDMFKYHRKKIVALSLQTKDATAESVQSIKDELHSLHTTRRSNWDEYIKQQLNPKEEPAEEKKAFSKIKSHLKHEVFDIHEKKLRKWIGEVLGLSLGNEHFTRACREYYIEILQHHHVNKILSAEKADSSLVR